jgi:CubicO group peptidase (beta-lactamase class C family)
VIVAKNGVPVFSQAYGFADREKKIANTVDTRFRIGSMNKMFTSVALLQLVQAGKVKLDAPIATYIPTYPNQDLAKKVTPHHLLSHTGGTGDIFGPEFEKKRLELRTHADYVKLYGARALEFSPGERFAYSNYGMLLGGYLIEKVTGKTYYDAVAANVFAPAGMKSTASPPEDKHEPGRVVPYSREDRKQPWKAVPDTLPYRGTAAGGGDSTVVDLLAFASALTSHKLIDAKHLELATSRKLPDGPPYGYGFQSETNNGVRCFGHGGGAPGMNGELSICDSGYTIAVLANVDPPAASRIASFISARLPAK